MLHFLAIEACSTATIWPFMLASSAAVCLSPPTKKAAGQKITIAAAVAHAARDLLQSSSQPWTYFAPICLTTM